MTTFPPKSPCPTCGCDLALSAAPPVQMEAVARSGVIEICQDVADAAADYAINGDPENAARREGMEAAATLIKTSTSLLPPLYASPVPAPVQMEAAADIPEGWQLVPIELTEDMAAAIELASGTEQLWLDVLSAAPAPPSPVPSSERDELGGIFLIETERVGDQDRFSIWDVFNECFQPGFYLTRMDAIAAIKKLRPLPDRDDIIEMCAATVERHVRDIDARPDSWMAAWAKECAAKLRSLKSSGEGST